MSERTRKNSPGRLHLRWACLALVLAALLAIVTAGSSLVKAGDAVVGLDARPQEAEMAYTTQVTYTVFFPVIQACLRPGAVTISGPSTGVMGLTQVFTATVSPDNCRLPIVYTWHVPGQPAVVHTGGLEDVLEVQIKRAGAQALVVEARNDCGATSSGHDITLSTRGLVAFERQDEGGGTHDIWLVDSEGSGVQFNLTNTPDIDEGAPTWSPDGNWLAYSALLPSGLRAIQKMDLSSGAVIALTDGSQDDRWPTWSPLGDRIAFMRNRAGLPEGRYIPDIWVMDADGTSQQQITDWLYSDDFPAWSPDGEWIAFTKEGEDFTGRDLWLVDPDHPETIIRVTNTPRPNPDDDQRDEIYPTWSPDGWIYHTFKYHNAGQDKSELLYRIRADGTGREQVFADSYNRWIASFAPDGNCFVFYSYLGSGDKEVWKWCQGFTSAVNLTNNDVSDEFCAWSPAP